jgi:hypothetical protein
MEARICPVCSLRLPTLTYIHTYIHTYIFLVTIIDASM